MNIVVVERQVSPLGQHGGQEDYAVKVDSTRHATGHCKTRPRHERLDFDQHRAGALEGNHDRRATPTFDPIREKCRGWVQDLREPAVAHLEYPNLAGSPKPVLYAP